MSSPLYTLPMYDAYARLVEMRPETLNKILLSAIILAVLWLLKTMVCSVVKRRMTDSARVYHWRRLITYIYTALAVVLIGRVWIRGFDSLATFLGLASAGLAIALHETIANVMGWLFIVTRKPFKLGDRIQIGETIGDVIDIRLFQFSMVEIGNWVDAEQSTGRIVHVPNSRALRDTIANYETGFEYIWHEIPVLITFESNWQEAKRILARIAHEKAEYLSRGAEEQIRLAAMKYLVFFRMLTPIVYTTVRDSGVLLTIRYIVKPRNRRGSEEAVWEAILTEFANHDDIDLAYATTRFFMQPSAPAPLVLTGPGRSGIDNKDCAVSATAEEAVRLAVRET